MSRVDAMIERLEQADAQVVFEAQQAQRREGYRRYYHEHIKPTGQHLKPKTSRNYYRRWQDQQNRNLFIGHPCQQCGSTDQLEVSHVQPLEHGGSDERSNLQ